MAKNKLEIQCALCFGNNITIQITDKIIYTEYDYGSQNSYLGELDMELKCTDCGATTQVSWDDEKYDMYNSKPIN